MDKLDKIFELQKLFDDNLIEKRQLDGISMEQWIQMEALALISEVSELIDEVNFKWWKNPKPVNIDNVKEEIVDVLHFFVAMCLKVGMSADELYDIYVCKNKENHDRQAGVSIKKGYDLSQNDNIK